MSFLVSGGLSGAPFLSFLFFPEFFKATGFGKMIPWHRFFNTYESSFVTSDH